MKKSFSSLVGLGLLALSLWAQASQTAPVATAHAPANPPVAAAAKPASVSTTDHSQLEA
jgi:hypothetical protein